MTSITIPNPSRKRALLIIDVQTGFTNDRSAWIIPNIVRLITDGTYTSFVCAKFHADQGSQWDKQSGWTFELTPTVPEIKDILDFGKTIFITKTARSIFIEQPGLVQNLRDQGIEEVHIVGYDINDCVLTTANDAFDYGFYTYVIEEASESSQSKELCDAALLILRENEMTNHSELISEKKVLE
ncbi:MAG: isochorismatase family cysteine hydrolase [bacterium]